MILEDKLDNIGSLHHIVTSTPVITDIVTSICGKFIGDGTFRDVYEYALDSDYVVKLEYNNSNCNRVEYNLWDEIKELTGELAWVKDWFAPVKWISPNGRVLVMKKTKEVHSKLKRPDKVPAFLWDVKWTNFGWLGDNYVCHDYGQFYNMIHYPKRMKKVDWEKAGY